MASFWSFCALLSLGILGLGADAQSLTVKVTDTGDYTISRKDGSVWLRSAPTFFVINWVKYSVADPVYKLTLKGVSNSTEGGFLSYNILYQANKTDIVASLHVFNEGTVGFSVTYPKDNGTTVTLGGSADGVISGFPGFQLDPPPARLGYMSYGLSTLEAAIGRWENGSTLVYGGRQGSGPLVLFDKTNNAVAMGPASSFTLTSLWHDVAGAAVYWGIMGAVTQLPSGFQYSVVVVDSPGRVDEALNAWATAVGLVTSSPRDFSAQDSILDTVGYWTGPGSAYYAGPEVGKTYADTLYDVRRDASNYTRMEPRVDYMYVELDDWWYEKGQDGGVKTWTANKAFLPNGVAGLANKTRWSVAASCGVWSADTSYSLVNGGKYNFTSGLNCSLPNDQTFWDDLFAQAVEDWMRIFVQKNMEQQYLCMTSGDTDVSTVMTWLAQQNVSATKHSMELVYSGAVPRLVMEAAFTHTAQLAIQVGPGPENLTVSNLWKVGVANMFVNALRLRPFFGIIRSYSLNETSDAQLPPMLQSILATLTGGPVAIGDQLGKSDRMLIEKCCSAEGQVLYPSVPGRPINDQLQEIAWGSNSGSLGEVWTSLTSTRFNTEKEANFFQGIVFATAMNRSYSLTPSSAGFIFPDAGDGSSGDEVYKPTKVFSYDNPTLLHDFSDTSPLTLSGCSVQDFCLYYVAPVFTFKNKEVVLMGDLTKWVPLSPQRVLKVTVGDTILITTRGQPDEKVYMWLHVDERLQSLEHRIGLDGTGLVEFELPHIDSSATKMAANTGARYLLMLCVCLFLFVRKLW